MKNAYNVKTYTCIINATYISFLACFSFLGTFSCCFPFYSVYAFLTLVCKKGKNKEIPRKQSKGKTGAWKRGS